MIYVINIVTSTKDTDVYDAVAVNKFPIVIEMDDDLDALKEILNNQSESIKNMLKSQRIYDNSKLYIRSYNDETDELKDEVVDLPEWIKIKY